MKAVAGVFGALVGLAIVAGLGFVLFSHPASGPANAGSRVGRPDFDPSASATSADAGAPRPEQPLSAPLSREAQLRQDLSRKRIPYFRFLHDNFGDTIEHFSVLDDLDTLDLYVSRSDNKTLMDVVQRAVAPRASEYGFRRVRFYVPNPATAATPFAIVAEATDDGSGRWSIFQK